VTYKSNYRVRGRSRVKYKAPAVDYVERRTTRVVRPVKLDFAQRLERGQRTVKELQLPPSELERASRYRETIEEQIRDAEHPTREEAAPPAEKRRAVGDRDQRERPQEKSRETRERKEPRKDGKDRPSKQEPKTRDAGKDRNTGKDRDAGKGGDAGKRTPKKKKG
jgi:hypothetical protein